MGTTRGGQLRQKLDFGIDSIKEEQPMNSTSASSAPYHRSQTLCPNTTQVFGYATLTALRNDLKLYFEVINGKLSNVTNAGSGYGQELNQTGNEGVDNITATTGVINETSAFDDDNVLNQNETQIMNGTNATIGVNNETSGVDDDQYFYQNETETINSTIVTGGIKNETSAFDEGISQNETQAINDTNSTSAVQNETSAFHDDQYLDQNVTEEVNGTSSVGWIKNETSALDSNEYMNQNDTEVMNGTNITGDVGNETSALDDDQYLDQNNTEILAGSNFTDGVNNDTSVLGINEDTIQNKTELMDGTNITGSAGNATIAMDDDQYLDQNNTEIFSGSNFTDGVNNETSVLDINEETIQNKTELMDGTNITGSANNATIAMDDDQYLDQNDTEISAGSNFTDGLNDTSALVIDENMNQNETEVVNGTNITGNVGNMTMDVGDDQYLYQNDTEIFAGSNFTDGVNDTSALVIDENMNQNETELINGTNITAGLSNETGTNDDQYVYPSENENVNDTNVSPGVNNETISNDTSIVYGIINETIATGDNEFLDQNETIMNVSTPPAMTDISPTISSPVNIDEISTDFEIKPNIPIKFNICPGSHFQFDNELKDTVEEPLVIQTLTKNPIWIQCMGYDDANAEEYQNKQGGNNPTDSLKGDNSSQRRTSILAQSSCLFSGGRVHMEFINHGSSATAIDDGKQESSRSPNLTLTVKGITFLNASEASILMNDPRGDVVFDSCTWENNKGAALKINGRYNSTAAATVDSSGSPEKFITDNDTSDDIIQDDFSLEAVLASLGTASPSRSPNSDPVTYSPSTAYPSSSIRIPASPTHSPWPTIMEVVYGSDDQYPMNENTSESFVVGNSSSASDNKTLATKAPMLLPSTRNSEATAIVDSSTTWSGFGPSGTTTTSTQFSIETTMATVTTSFAWADSGSSMESLNAVDGELVTPSSPVGRRDLEIMIEPSASSPNAQNRFLSDVVGTKAIVDIRSCSFRKNNGPASILVASYSSEMILNDPGVLQQTDDVFGANSLKAGFVKTAHSIHVDLANVTFNSDNVEKSVIFNDGARLQISYSSFLNNTGESIIHSESGTLSMTQTEFSHNSFTGDAGMIDMDGSSTLESNDHNCDTTDVSAVLESDALVGASARFMLEQGSSNVTNSPEMSFGGDLSQPTSVISTTSSSCPGIYFQSVCRPLGDSCIPEEPIVIGGCISLWDDLVGAIRNRAINQSDFIICPGSVLDIEASAEKAPAVIDSNYITIKCGSEGLLKGNCAIVGGFAQFQILGPAVGVKLSGLRMASSKGSSIIAAGTKEATLHLNECEWLSNTGASAIVIHSGNTSYVSKGILNITQLMSKSLEAMSVEVTDCLFRSNNLSFGTVANIGGTLTVYRSLFERNMAKGGDIVVTNKGSCKVQESCFSDTYSTFPGTIFVEFGSSIAVNKENFGINNTALISNCNSVFQEATDNNCLKSKNCDGICKNFTSSFCSLPAYDSVQPGLVPALAPEGVAVQSETENTNKNLIPIIVASAVGAFVVSGLIGFIIYYVKRKKGGGGASRRWGGNSRGSFRKVSFSKKDVSLENSSPANPFEELDMDDDSRN